MEIKCNVCGGTIKFQAIRFGDEGIQILENALMGVPERIALAADVDVKDMDVESITICKICLDQIQYDMNWA